MSERDPRFKGLFIGEGVQRERIASCRNTTVRTFMRHDHLSQHYRAADIAVWPRQESMSMLDAAASGLPVVVSDRMGEPQRIAGNGRTYVEGSVESLCETLRDLAGREIRESLGRAGRARMQDGFSWSRFADVVEDDFLRAAGRRHA